MSFCNNISMYIVLELISFISVKFKPVNSVFSARVLNKQYL